MGGPTIEAVNPRDSRRYGTGSLKQSKVAEPVSGTRGWRHTSTGNDTWIIAARH